MKLSELMKGYEPQKEYKGAVTNDDWVLAVDVSEDQTPLTDDNMNEETVATTVANYAVVGDYIESIDSNMNPSTTDKQYIRSGMSTTKTGTQRTFTISGDRYIGDDFQDFALSNKIKYGTGNAVIVNYVYFSLLNGAGEYGQISVIVNGDASGSAGENSTIDIELRKYGSNPKEFTYKASV